MTQTTHKGPRSWGRAQDPDDRPLAMKNHPAVCPDCGALWKQGRWQWGEATTDMVAIRCEACERIAANEPAGIVTLAGGAARDKADEIEHLIRHQEEAEKGEHPLNRIIAITRTADGLIVTTTDAHLPHRIGEAVRRAYHCSLKTHAEPDDIVRVEGHWAD